MIDLFKVRMSPRAGDAVAKVLASGYIGQGPKVEELEDALQEELGSRNRPITVNSCTSALDLALHLAGVGPGDEVISTPVTCFATNSVIINRGAKIVWADVDPNTFCVTPETIAAALTPDTKAVMVVNWAGRSIDIGRIRTICGSGIPIIEDAAHSWNISSIADYAAYSLQAIKFLTSGDGGVLTVPDDKEEEARLLRWYGLDRTKGESFRCTQNIKKAGYKYHMNDVAATIALSNLGLATDSVMRHRLNAGIYDDELKDLDTISLPPTEEDDGHPCAYWLYSIKVQQGTKEKFMEHLKEHGIASSPVHYRNDYYDATQQFFPKETMPGVQEFADKQVSIPVGWWMSLNDLDHVIRTIRSYKG